MKAKAQKAQTIRNSLGASVKAKAQKAQKAQIIRNSLGASVQAKAQKAQITRNRLGPATANP